jgi:hypothetical protein
MSVCLSRSSEELGNPHGPGLLLEYIVAKMGPRGHCWNTAMTSNRIIATMTLDTIVAFVIPFE